jgi:hypothetical protein
MDFDLQKDVGHKHDWGVYNDMTSMLDSSIEQFEDRDQGRDHPKFYFGKRRHSVYWDMQSRNRGVQGE